MTALDYLVAAQYEGWQKSGGALLGYYRAFTICKTKTSQSVTSRSHGITYGRVEVVREVWPVGTKVHIDLMTMVAGDVP